jgi:hypothetical protein
LNCDEENEMTHVLKMIFATAALLTTLQAFASTTELTAPLSQLQALETHVPGLTDTYLKNPSCAGEAWREAMHPGEWAAFNPLIPHCNALHVAYYANLSGYNLTGAMAMAQVALLSGCLNPSAFAMKYFGVYGACMRR